MLIHRRNASDEDLKSNDKGEKYVISYPPVRYMVYLPFGRATRGMLAYDCSREKSVFVKDYWRSTAGRMEKEGDIYHGLEKANVCNVASLGCGNDFPSHNGRLADNGFINAKWVCHRPPGSSLKVAQLYHYRMALTTVGNKLTKFASTKKLVTAIADAMQAHDEAYFNAGILHRDISVGNIMIDDEGRGFLIDWHLCTRVTPGDQNEGSQRQERTGTWQFMSVKVLEDPKGPQGIQDDRESAFHVLTWTLLNYAEHDRVAELADIFSAYDERRLVKGEIRGGRGKYTLLALVPFIATFAYDPLNALIKDLQLALKVRYEGERPDADNLAQMKQQSWLVDIFRRNIQKDGWPEQDDPAKAHKPEP